MTLALLSAVSLLAFGIFVGRCMRVGSRSHVQDAEWSEVPPKMRGSYLDLEC